MFPIALAILFILKLRFPRSRPITDTITRRYGRCTLQLFRKIEKCIFKVKKTEEDLKFLNTCYEYRTIPNFIKFKVYTKRFHNTRTYHSWQFKLLDFELRSQTRRKNILVSQLSDLRNELRNKVSFLDFKCLTCVLDSNVEKKLVDVRLIHIRKLKNLGIDISKKIDCNKVIFNLSNRILTDEEKDVLSLGLDFGLIPAKVNYVKYYLCFEKLCNTLKSCNIYGRETMASIFNRISCIANETFSYVSRRKEGDSPVNKNRIAVLKNLKNDENIIVTKPDKGRGIVLLNRVDYNRKMYEILSDVTKFRLLNVDIASHILKLEDKLNRLLRVIKDKIGDFNYNAIYASGSRPGCMYGLPKIHKVGNPLRPIISSIGTFNYNLAKFLVPVLKPLTCNQYSVGNSSKFVKELCSFDFDSNVVMASLDVESLFTNIPLKETTDIILNNLDQDHISRFEIDKSVLGKLLDLATCNCVFLFDGKLYNQIDGVGMGSSLGPVYADCFMGYYENIWLSDCPIDFKPLFYRRYVDDTFLVFRDMTHVELFHNYINQKHPNIRFTLEVERDHTLPFLDIKIFRNRGRFTTSVFRKDTFTGLGLNFLSYSPKLYKNNSIKTLINRAYNICSDFNLFHLDMMFLLNYFAENAYLSSLFYRF